MKPGCFTFTAHRRQKSAAGFSFADLLTVLGVLALLVLLQISAFAHNFRSPKVHQVSVSLERELANRVV